MERESDIEQYLIRSVEFLNGKALKINSTSMVGMPDRMVLWPGGHLIFVELKATGKKLRPTQLVAKRMLEKLGFTVEVLDSKDKVDEFVTDSFYLYNLEMQI